VNPRGGKAFEYKVWLSALLSHKHHQSAFKRAMFKDSHPHFMTATKHAAAYVHGLAVQPTVDLTPKAPAHLAGIQLAEALPRLVGLLPGSSKTKAELLAAVEADYEIIS
jgi:hypothetical protein